MGQTSGAPRLISGAREGQYEEIGSSVNFEPTYKGFEVLDQLFELAQKQLSKPHQ